MDLNNITNNLTDIILLLILIVSFFIGYSRGFIKESLALSGWILSGWISINYYALLAIHIRKLINHQIIADAISFGALFLSIVILTTIITHIISSNIKNSLLSPLDKLLGIIFSIIRSLLIISIISIGLQQTIWEEKSIPEKYLFENSSVNTSFARILQSTWSNVCCCIGFCTSVTLGTH